MKVKFTVVTLPVGANVEREFERLQGRSPAAFGPNTIFRQAFPVSKLKVDGDDPLPDESAARHRLRRITRPLGPVKAVRYLASGQERWALGATWRIGQE